MKTCATIIKVALKMYFRVLTWPFFFCRITKINMNTERDQMPADKPETDQPLEKKEKQHSSAFNERSRGDEKSTTNIEEEAALEQQRKESMTERD
jgi:hypothetical protein